MFDIGWSELLVIAIVALVVIGPKDLPRAFRIAGQWAAKARAMAREFQGHIDELMRESQMEEMKRDFNDMTKPPDFADLESDLMAGNPLDRPKTTAKEPAKVAVPTVPPLETLATDAPLAQPPAP
ncbi:MAG: Sec-independent protein translocase protein TatB [Alphaproteobacteria bacterium]|nr:Sec-independent protein translocase protein TatB [Alphaproteobacteria bacterium]